MQKNCLTIGLNIDELLGQGFLVFIAGYETTAALLSFLAYVLATHPEVQDKLVQEIDEQIHDVDVSLIEHYKTCPCNIHRFEPHFHCTKMGYTGYYITWSCYNNDYRTMSILHFQTLKCNLFIFLLCIVLSVPPCVFGLGFSI